MPTAPPSGAAGGPDRADSALTITVGVTTYDRLPLLEDMATSLTASDHLREETVHVRVYDDCSTDFDLGTLRALFPTATELTRRPVNLGANANMHRMHEEFLDTGDDVLFHADADLIFHPGWLGFVRDWLPRTDGILRIYNSAQEPGVGEVTIDGHRFLVKDRLGSAGVAVHRDRLTEVVDRCEPTETYDWDWTTLLRERGHRLLVSPRSWVQHLGMTGYNSDGMLFVDFGLGFVPGSPINEALAIRLTDELLSRTDAVVRERIAESTSTVENIVRYDTLAYRLGERMLRPARSVNALLSRTPGLRRLSASAKALALDRLGRQR